MVYTSVDIQVFYNIKKCIISDVDWKIHGFKEYIYIYIPKGILSKIRKLCFSFLWTASKKTEGIALVKWKTLDKPKKLGDRGIKNLDLFTKALATKTLWRLLQNPEKLWSKVIVAKYCPDNSILDWIRTPNKTFKNGSIGWKAMVMDFTLFGK